MRITVLGGSGAWPAPDAACSGFLVEHDGFRLLMDVGYAVVPRLLAVVPAARIDAVVISHGHPDHCADLNPLLRARALGGDPAPALPVYALPGALDAVLALDRPGMLDDAIALRHFAGGDRFGVGPFTVDTRLREERAALRLSALAPYSLGRGGKPCSPLPRHGREHTGGAGQPAYWSRSSSESSGATIA
jgi:ribonuclease BN (tRNA processing enzyme)